MIINPNDKIIAGPCKTAIKYAKTFGKTLDYSKESITYVEDILDFYSKDLNAGILKKLVRKLTGKQPTNNQIRSMSIIWGTYIGEVLRLHLPDSCVWRVEDVLGDGEVLHLNISGMSIFPIDKALKRLLNGSEDNVVSFYDLGLKWINEQI